MNVAARRAVTLERELRQALAGEQFVVHYQPQLDLATDQLVGVEALVRWNHPYRGLVRPGEFIGLAEDIGLIAPLTAWVLRSACRQQRAWQDRGLTGLQMSVNLSPVQFRERGIELLVERVLAESSLDRGVARSRADRERGDREQPDRDPEPAPPATSSASACRSTISAPATPHCPTSSGCRCSGSRSTSPSSRTSSTI